MAEVTAALVKQLREQTGAGMMDCKKALAESAGDMEAATDWLRKKGLSKAQKKAGRATAEGLVAVQTAGPRGSMVEVNAETDFVARNGQFQEFAAEVAKLALQQGGDMESLKGAVYPTTGRRLDDELTQQIATIGENLDLRRMAFLSVDRGVVAGYCHNQMQQGLGKMGVLVAVESDGDASVLAELGRNIAMHVAATGPIALGREDVDRRQIEREREVLAEQARASGKPENIVEKMVEGRLRKFYEENCLLEQVYVVDGESKVSDVVERTAHQLGTSVKVTDFRRFTLGEGKEAAQNTEEAAQPAAG